MGIGMSGAQADMFAAYHEMLVEANAKMNLTRVPDDPVEAADRNYLDCIAVLAGILLIAFTVSVILAVASAGKRKNTKKNITEIVFEEE